MANTLTGLVQTIYTALDVVSRELVGMIPRVNRDARSESAAVGQTVTYPVTRNASSVNITPSMTVPEGTDQTIDPESLTISKSKSVQIPWTGEERRSLENGGIYNTILQDQFQQAFRTITNEVELDLLTAGYQGSSRAVGTAGTAPFPTADDMSDLANMEEVLDDNGSPSMRSAVLTTRGYVNLRSNMSNMFKVNESGESAFLRTDVLGVVYNFAMGKTTQKISHTKGTGTLYVSNGGSAIGDTSIPLDTGSGTILTGDVVTFAGDTNKYVVNTGIAAPGSIVIGGPGLIQTLADSGAATVGDSYTLAGLGFSRDAMLLASRTPALPEGGDEAVDEMMVTDPLSGLTFRVAMYKGYHKMMVSVELAWGVKAVKPAHIVTLLG